ncbi:MAG: hypothetical protein K5921_00605 [Lachnospiraceae bacterium]|nr:hypothetical protein [Lachnospiraceae bacterium]
MRINGIVTGNIDIYDDSVSYEVNAHDNSYHVISKDKQAVKDAIFIRAGQHISVDGERISESIVSKRSQIDITRIER